MRVLVVNTGSSSQKLSVMDGDRTVAAATAEHWEGAGHLDPIKDFVKQVEEVDAVGHRVIHRGPRLTQAVPLDDEGFRLPGLHRGPSFHAGSQG